MAHPGLEEVVAAELKERGFSTEVLPGGVKFTASLGQGAALARVLRTPDRLLLEMATGSAHSPDALAALVRRADWKGILHPYGALEVQVSSATSRVHFTDSAERKVAWAIGEALKGPRLPEGSARSRLTQRVQVRIVNDQATLSVDASGDLLHKRGWRLEASRAPLRENLAAAMLRLAEWDGREALLDPFCGSGTILIEAALMAAGRSPHTSHPFACDEWPGVTRKALDPGSPTRPILLGSDHDAEALRRAAENAARARVDVGWRLLDVSDAEAPAPSGLVVTNPPWGKRLAPAAAVHVYTRFGRALHERLPGWRACFLAPGHDLGRHVDRSARQVTSFTQGGVRVGVWVV